MNFLDLLKKETGRTAAGKKGSCPAKMPLVVVLLGKYEPAETALLREQLGSHMSLADEVFWIVSGDIQERAENTYCLPFDNVKMQSIEDREQFAAKADDEELNRFLDKAATEIMNKTGGISFQESNEIRIAMLVKTDEAASGLMFPMAKMLADNFSLYFFRNVYLELFLLTNQGGIPQEERHARWASNYRTFQEAQKLYRQETIPALGRNVAHMVYVFSSIRNDNGKGVLLSGEELWREQYTSIALLLTLKTMCGENQEYRYTDQAYQAGAANQASRYSTEQSGILNSAGCIHMERNEYLIHLIVCRTVWEELSRLNEDLETDDLRRELGLREEDLRDLTAAADTRPIRLMDSQSIVCHPVNPDLVYQMRNGQAVRKIFGSNLDLFLELNIEPNSENGGGLAGLYDSLKARFLAVGSTLNAGPYDLGNFLLAIEQLLLEKEERAAEMAEKYKEDFEAWKNQLSRVGKKGKGEEIIHALAESYRSNAMKYRSAGREKENYEKVLQTIQRIGKDYHSFVETVDQIKEQLSQEIEDIADSGRGVKALQAANTEEYYRKYTTDLLRQNPAFGRLKKSLGDYLGDEQRLMQDVLDFCDQEILKEEAFSWSFMEELYHRLPGHKPDGKHEIQTEEDVLRYLLAVAEESLHYMCTDMMGGTTHYQYVSYFTNDGERLVKALQENKDIGTALLQKRGFGLFCDSRSDQFDVLYQAGNIVPDRLQFMENYKKEAEKVYAREVQ